VLTLPGLLPPWPDGTAELVLLAWPAWLARPRGDGSTRPARVAELAEDLAQPVVDSFKDGGPFGEVHILKRGEAGDGRVDARITGGGERRPSSLRIHDFLSPPVPRSPDWSCGTLPSRVNGTAQRGARRTCLRLKSAARHCKS
jgi:hypothetical protein